MTVPQNELKRTHNKLEELTKKHNRALNELAVAKCVSPSFTLPISPPLLT